MKRTLSVAFTLFLFVIAVWAQQGTKGSLHGRVFDSASALLGGVDIVLIDSTGAERKVKTNSEGAFVVNDIDEGKYILHASSTGFASYENTEVVVVAGKTASLDITLDVTINEQVNINNQEISTNPESNATATVLGTKEVETLPDDPAELTAALQALAGPGAGPNGGEIFVDGFSGAKLPRRDSIKEIRLNQNPFSSEYDRMGLGRIEIITKPGTEDWGGEFQSQFEDESLNSRNPYATNRPPYQLRSFEGELTGPIIKNRASFFVDAEHQSIDDNSLINARARFRSQPDKRQGRRESVQTGIFYTSPKSFQHYESRPSCRKSKFAILRHVNSKCRCVWRKWHRHRQQSQNQAVSKIQLLVS